MLLTNKIYCGDALALLRGIPDKSIDCIITDPPYGIDFDYYSNGRGGSLSKQRDYGKQDWNKVRPSKECFYEMLRVSKNQVIFGGNHFTDSLPPSTGWIVWDKDNTGNFGDCELAWTSFKRTIRKFKWRWNGMLQENMKHKDIRFHPTQKPLAVMEWIVATYTQEDSTILDPFCGSGTTLLAAKNLGREWIGIEINPAYAKKAQRRIVTAPESLFTTDQ